MKKQHLYVICCLFPFVVVWLFWLLTAMSFSARDVFKSEPFWYVTLIYYTVLIWFPLAMINEITNEEV